MDRPGTSPFVQALAQIAIENGVPPALRQRLEIQFTDSCRQFDGGNRGLMEALKNVVHVHYNGTEIDMQRAIEDCEAAIRTGGKQTKRQEQ